MTPGTKFLIQWLFLLPILVFCTFGTIQFYRFLGPAASDDPFGEAIGVAMASIPFVVVVALFSILLQKYHVAFQPPFLSHYILRSFGFKTLLDNIPVPEPPPQPLPAIDPTGISDAARRIIAEEQQRARS
jgi:hypothetical protein